MSLVTLRGRVSQLIKSTFAKIKMRLLKYLIFLILLKSIYITVDFSKMKLLKYLIFLILLKSMLIDFIWFYHLETPPLTIILFVILYCIDSVWKYIWFGEIIFLYKMQTKVDRIQAWGPFGNPLEKLHLLCKRCSDCIPYSHHMAQQNARFQTRRFFMPNKMTWIGNPKT